MRYMIINYRQIMQRTGMKMAPQTDEIVSVSKKLKMRDLQTASVILDFQERRVVQATMDGNTIPKEWDTIRNYYHQHYKRLVEDLESLYGHQIPTASNPDTDPVSN